MPPNFNELPDQIKKNQNKKKKKYIKILIKINQEDENLIIMKSRMKIK